MPARDASGVPLPLRELIDALAALAQLPPLAAAGQYAGYHQAVGNRDAVLRTLLGALGRALAIHDKYPASAAQELARDCRQWTAMVREVLAEPLGYEPEHGQDDTKEESGGS